MDRYIHWLIALALLTSPNVFADEESQLPNPKASTANASNESKVGYVLGMQAGQSFAGSGLDEKAFDFTAFMEGLRDGLQNASPKVSQEDFRAAIESVSAAARARYEQQMKPVAERNRREGAAFLAKFKTLEGVKSLPSGVLFKVMTAATGPSPKATDTVRVHYRGRFVNRKEFENSYDSGKPAVFRVDEVIPGWTETLQKMKVGEKWQIVLPPKSAYGEFGKPPEVGPQSVLVFDIELLGIEQPPQ